jgi:hypothetical protein
MEPLKQLVTERDTWTGAEGENEGTPFILRFRPHLQDFIIANRYHKHLTITWTYESEDDSLMPDDSDMNLMNQVEDSLVEALESDVQAVLAFVYTGQNQKEWHWYSGDLEETGRRHNEALSYFERFPIALTAEDDPDWDEYLSVLEGVSSSDGEEDEVQ